MKHLYRDITHYAVLLVDSWRYAREDSRERTQRQDRRKGR